MSFAIKYRNHAFVVGIVGGITGSYMLVCAIRRSGFGSTYSRVEHIAGRGEYHQVLEPGMYPSNDHLPPHLRLDQLSYLDMPETEVAVPPMIDLATTERDSIRSLEGQLPSKLMSVTHFQFGPFKSESIIMPAHASERYVRRGLGLSDRDRAEVEREASTQRH